MNTKVIIGIAVCIAVVAAIGLGLGRGTADASTSGSTESATKTPALPEDLVVNTIEGEALVPAEARKNAKLGDTVLLTGQIGGKSNPFVPNRAMFVVTGEGTSACASACGGCSSSKGLMAVTVQVVDDKGKVIAASLNGYKGLKAGAKVRVQAMVLQNDEHVFLVNAEEIAVLQ